jgi:SAM-dependent methyltransferase
VTRATADQIDEALSVPIAGWDFSWLRGRAVETQPPWNYGHLVKSAVEDARRVLDIDTGGGEFLAAAAPFSATVVATEGYAPNAATAARRLSPLGISVVRTASAPDNIEQVKRTPEEDRSCLPFASGAFDLVVNRHSSYWPSEVHRLLIPRGRFVTQQRGEAGRAGVSWAELFERLRHPHEGFTLRFAAEQLEAAGFDVSRAEEADTPMVFGDLAGVVYYLRMVPWAVEDFDPEKDRDSLEDIAKIIAARGDLRVRGSHLLVDARRR